jgi:dihydrodipicolinate synthase/N-acetylneuraminate lyase
MMKSVPRCFVMSITPFTPDGSIDEPAMTAHIKRLVDAGCGMYIGSPGTGEGHALSDSELDRIYRLAVEVSAGTVPVNANPPEGRTPARAIELAQLAARAGVDSVEIYTLDPGHGMAMTNRERDVYYDGILGQIDHPVTLSLQRPIASNWQLSIEDIVTLAARHQNIEGVHVQAMTTQFRLMLKGALGKSVAVYGPAPTALQDSLLGLDGFQSAEANIFPELAASIARVSVTGDVAAAAAGFRTLMLFLGQVDRWGTAVRWGKLALEALGLPGGNGIVRPPYVYPAEGLTDMKAILTKLGDRSAAP